MKRIALVGCGAIADAFHLPALTALDGVGVTLVDPDPDRARRLGAKHDVTDVAASHREVVDRIDAAIIASPHHTHVPIATDLVEAGVPVLCEKPLGVSVAEVETLRDLAVDRDVVVAVNQTRRFIPACAEIRRLLAEGTLGPELEILATEGDKFDWPAATPSMFGAGSGGRGLLLDIGAHVLDLMVWWAGPELVVRSYRDDSFGGSEAAVEVELDGPGVSIRIKLSWLAKQRNAYEIRGAAGTLHWGVYDLDMLTMTETGGRPRALRLSDAPRGFADLAPRVLRDFLRAVDRDGSPMAGPDDVLPSMRLMDLCYRDRGRFDMPWHTFDGAATGAG